MRANHRGVRQRPVATEDRAVEGRHGSVPIRVYRPRQPRDVMPLLWVHGGAFFGGNLDMTESHEVALDVAATGRHVVTVDYHRVHFGNPLRRPPEGQLPGVRYPIPLDDVLDAWTWTVTSLGAERGAVLGGASAGACLAAAAALRLINDPEHHPRGLILAYGTFHAYLPAFSPALRRRLGPVRASAAGPWFVRRMNLAYLGNRQLMGAPGVMPGGADLRSLPPTLSLDADRDLFRASGDAFFEELVEAGVQTTRHVVSGSGHGFLNQPRKPSYAWATKEICSWLQRIESES